MKNHPIYLIFALLLGAFSIDTQCQTFGPTASAVWVSDCNQSNFYNTSGTAGNTLAPAPNVFNNQFFGVHSQNSGTLVLRGAQVSTFKAPLSNVCKVELHYRVYPSTGTPGPFSSIDLTDNENCDGGTGQFASGGTCVPGDQKWQLVIADGTFSPYAPIDLTNYGTGNYTLEIYYTAIGSFTSTTQCNDTVILNNGGSNYKAFFAIQAPMLTSNNPTSCNGSQGSITISGLAAGSSYQLSYTDDGTAVGPSVFVANGAGQIIVTGLNAGLYSDFLLEINGCATNLSTGIILSNPIFVPKFNAIAAFCAGTTPPSLPAASTNGINGTWSPAIVDNQTSRNYTFTPVSGQCGVTTTLRINIIPRTIPVFSFGTSLSICANGVTPVLPNMSTNSVSGTWTPSVVSNQNSGTYTFSPNAGQCASSTTLTVTINPNITPAFSFGSSLTICAGDVVPALPAISDNGVSGSWSPSVVNNQNSGTYNFTPAAGQCAPAASFSVTVNPMVTPTFAFGTSLNICAGNMVPALPATSNNSITGTWSPSIIDNQNAGSYTFSPGAGQCATTTTLTVSINPMVTPTFSFGTSITICAGGMVPALTTTSSNGITGTWSPSIVDNQNSGTYTFTPDPGTCATQTNFAVSINPNITPTFSFGSNLSFCAGETVPVLPTTSSNGITGTWSPSVVDNQNSGGYTFNPDAAQCATSTTLTVTINPNVTPTFSFGSSLTICAGGTVPALPSTSANGISGAWSPAVVNNQNSSVYIFNPAPGTCAPSIIYTVNVNPNIAPSFSFGSSLTICEGNMAPALPTTSTNGITGTWSPSVIDNQSGATYTFTPSSGQCAIISTLAVTVSTRVTPTFAFGSSVILCAGDIAPALPTTSSNGITGTWSPSVVDNQNSGSYTFNPDAAQCATSTTLTVTINPNVTPTFSFGPSLTICAGGTVPALPSTSANGISGAWSPAVVDNQNSGAYIFNPAPGTCAPAITFTVTVNANATPTFSFGSSLSICEGDMVPALPATSTNAITGTWSPSVIDNQNAATYTFTPSSGQCALVTTLTVTINGKVTPTFSFGSSLTFCAGNTAPTLPTTSSNGITGTWSPSVIDNQNSGSYTFSPGAAQCATSITITVTINPNVTPTFSFGNSLTICAGASVPGLPSTSANGVNGTWSPAVVNNQNSGVYTFNPGPGNCAPSIIYTVTVNPNMAPTFSFGSSLSICEGDMVPALPSSSTNGVTGTWSPSVIDNQNGATYTFTPSAGQCAIVSTLMVAVSNKVTPTFNFGSSLTLCAGDMAPALPTTSSNGITGTWSPSVMDNQNSGSYTFNPDAAQCATSNTLTVSINPIVTPTFSFGNSLTICAGAGVPALPATSANGISGAWSPAVVNNQNSGVYTFNPGTGNCAASIIYTVTVNPNTTPTFSFGSSFSLCIGDMAPTLPTTSDNGIPGTWSPSVIDNQNGATYTFTPSAGQCAIVSTLMVTVSNKVTPTFPFGSSLTICAGGMVPALSTTSSNGITGTWNTSVVNNQNSATYTFTPATGQCATPTSFTVTVNQNVIPTFNLIPELVICAGENVPVLPTTSSNGITGTWSPAIVSNQASGIYNFTASSGQCILGYTYIVTVSPVVTPSFPFGTFQSICKGGLVPSLTTTSANGIRGSWNPATIDNQVNGTYTFTPDDEQCANSTSFTLEVNDIPTVEIRTDTSLNDGELMPGVNLVTTGGATATWSNSNTSVGLAASGNGNIPSFIAVNRTNSAINTRITITPTINGCSGAAKSFVLTVLPLDKNIFIPNVFSPNGDGKNDLLLIYGNYISKVEMRIFNQWGQQIAGIDDSRKGWDGRHRGSPQPVGVYVYVCKIILTDGKILNLKGSVTLVR